MSESKIDIFDKCTTIKNRIYINYRTFASYNKTIPEEVESFARKKEYILDYIIKNDEIFNAILEMLEKGVDTFKVFIDNPYGKTNECFKYIINILDIIGYLTLSSDFKSKIKLKMINIRLSSKVYRKKMLRSKVFFEMTCEDIIRLLAKSPEEFAIYINSKNNEFYGFDLNNSIESINLEKLAKDILNEKELINLKTNIKHISDNYRISEAVSKFVPFRGHVDDFDLDSSILEEIKKGMPEHYNDFQKAYYGYRRICDLFSYNEKYFINRSVEFLDDIERLNNIKIGDSVTCNELTMIFAKYLDTLNIPFRIVNHHFQNENDYKTHLGLILLANYAVASADLGLGAIKGDISFSKFFDSAQFFKSFDRDSQTSERIEQYKKEVDEYYNYNYFDERQKQSREIVRGLEYAFIEPQDRIQMLLFFIEAFEYNSMDLFVVIKYIAHLIFSKDESFCNIEFLINNQPYDEDEGKVVLCVTLNENGVQSDIQNNTYYIFNRGKFKEKLNLEEIREKFENGYFSYSKDKRHIPGVENKLSK